MKQVTTMDTTIRVLIFEDNPGDAGLIEEMLEESCEPFELIHVETLKDGLEILRDNSFDVILLDLGLPDSDGIDTFYKIHQKVPNLPIVILTGLADESVALTAIQEGAQDYFLKKDLESKILDRSIKYSVERKKSEVVLKASEEFLENIVENTPNMIFLKSPDNLNFEMVNKAGEELLGHSREEVIGKTNYDLFPKDQADFFTQTDREALQKKKLLDIPEETIETKKLDQIILHTKKIPIFNKEGNPQYILGISEDITESKIAEEQVKKSLGEKEVLLREIHHRVKNNLQIITSLLHLQEVSIDDEELVNILKESESRVNSMAIIHETLYQSPNLTDINFKQYLEKLVYDILYTYGIKKGIIDIQLDIDDINLNIDTAIPLGLIINELITNTVKYAFPQNEGTITIKLKSLSNNMEITIADDGIGLPKDINLENPETLGLQLVHSLIGQLDGKLKLNNDNGTEFKIIFKELKYKKRL
jgi:PAS domain S-box-containing protein